MQIDGALKEAARSCQIALGGEQEVHCIAALVDCGAKVLSIASNFDVGLIHPPTGSDRALAATKDMRHDWQNLQSPEVHRGMVHEDASLLHHFLQMAKAQGVSCIATSAHQHHFQRMVQALEYSAQFGDHRGFVHILHAATFMLGRLLRQNLHSTPDVHSTYPDWRNTLIYIFDNDWLIIHNFI